MQLADLWVQILADMANFLIAGAAVVAIVISQRNLREQQKGLIHPEVRPIDEGAVDAIASPPHMRDAYACGLVNLGSGGAYTVSAVVFGPAPRGNESSDPRRLAALRIPGIDPRETRAVALRAGTSLGGSMRLTMRRSFMARRFRKSDKSDAPYTLFAPADRAPVKPPKFQVTMPTLARMTITYKDSEGAKYGAIFDYVPGSGWQLIGYLPNIAKTLDELDDDANIALFHREVGKQPDAPITTRS